MKRIIMMLTVAALMVASLTITSAGAFAASPSQEQCEAQGGTFTKERGEVQCVQPGKNENQPKFQQTTTGQGNISNKQEQQCGDPCPPGQFK